MKVFKIILKVLFIIYIVFTSLFAFYFIFANSNYGVNSIKQIFENGFFEGIKLFFYDIWKGILFMFKG